MFSFKAYKYLKKGCMIRARHPAGENEDLQLLEKWKTVR